MQNKLLLLVHCVDTEGPKYESLEATFERLHHTFAIKFKPDYNTLKELRAGKHLDSSIRNAVADFLSPDRMAYNEDWSAIDKMLDALMSKEWRDLYMDDFGQGYIFNWFCLDHVGFTSNPRRRAMGYHAIFEHYADKLKQYSKDVKDQIHWHFHPVSFTKEAHKCSNNFSYTNEHLQILSRRVIDHSWFPSVFRPGQHTERPDINLFLEQWIPFDYGNQSIDASGHDNEQADLAPGRFGDWRRATTQWETYHPDFRDYQIKGNMHRSIARCLNLNARIRQINTQEVNKAFIRANEGLPTIMSVTDHDEREMRNHIERYYKMVKEIQRQYPEVKIKNCTAVEAFRIANNLEDQNPIELKVEIDTETNQLDIKSNVETWGSQPYFCFKTLTGEYIHENLDYHGNNHWSFVFDQGSIELFRLEKIGIATNDKTGNTSVYNIDLIYGNRDEKFYDYRG